MTSLSGMQIAIAVSELVTLVIVYRLWRSHDPLLIKLLLGLIAFIPFIGPVLWLWLSHFPAPQPMPLRDQSRFTTDVLDRWRDILAEKDVVLQQEKWKQLMQSSRPDDEPLPPN